MGVQSSLLVCCGLGKGLWPCPLAYLVGGIARAWKEAIQSLDNQSESYDCDLIKKSKAFSVGVGPHRNSVGSLGAGLDILVGLQPWCSWPSGRWQKKEEIKDKSILISYPCRMTLRVWKGSSDIQKKLGGEQLRGLLEASLRRFSRHV